MATAGSAIAYRLAGMYHSGSWALTGSMSTMKIRAVPDGRFCAGIHGTSLPATRITSAWASTGSWAGRFQWKPRCSG